MSGGKLYRKTQHLLINRPVSLNYYVIVDQCNAMAGRTIMTTKWLSEFAHGKSREPSVNKVEILYEVLTGENIDRFIVNELGVQPNT